MFDVGVDECGGDEVGHAWVRGDWRTGGAEDDAEPAVGQIAFGADVVGVGEEDLVLQSPGGQ